MDVVSPAGITMGPPERTAWIKFRVMGTIFCLREKYVKILE